MEQLILLSVFILGTIVGSFLNVVIYRINTGKSLNGRSHCLTCGTTLLWYELIPLFSYVFQRGKCNTCYSLVTPRYFFVEALTGVLFVLIVLTTADIVHIVLNLAIVSILVVIAVYDVRHTIIPDQLVVYLSVIALAYLMWSPETQSVVVPEISNILAGIGAGTFFALIWTLSKGKFIGLGDAKLAVPLGMLVGWPLTFSLIVLAFWIGAVLSVLILLFERTRRGGKLRLRFSFAPLTMKSEVPFAPFLIISFLLVHLFLVDVFTLTNHALLYIGI